MRSGRLSSTTTGRPPAWTWSSGSSTRLTNRNTNYWDNNSNNNSQFYAVQGVSFVWNYSICCSHFILTIATAYRFITSNAFVRSKLKQSLKLFSSHYQALQSGLITLPILNRELIMWNYSICCLHFILTIATAYRFFHIERFCQIQT